MLKVMAENLHLMSLWKDLQWGYLEWEVLEKWWAGTGGSNFQCVLYLFNRALKYSKLEGLMAMVAQLVATESLKEAFGQKDVPYLKNTAGSKWDCST